jgi:hypothetical protein
MVDGDDKYAITIDRESEAAVLLALGVIDNMKLGQTYEIAMYNKLDTKNYKRTHVMIKDASGQVLRSQNSSNFNAYVVYMKTARAKGSEFAASQGMVPNSRDFKKIIGSTLLRFRNNFGKQLIERANLSGSTVLNPQIAPQPAIQGFRHNMPVAPEYNAGYVPPEHTLQMADLPL